MKKKIYVVFSYDDDSCPTFTLRACCTSPLKLKRMISDGIRNQYFTYGSNHPSFSKQVIAFQNDWKSKAKDATDIPFSVIDRVKYLLVKEIEANQNPFTH